VPDAEDLAEIHSPLALSVFYKLTNPASQKTL